MTSQEPDMSRRAVLGTLGTATTVVATGCVTRRPIEFGEQGVRVPPGGYYDYRIDIEDYGSEKPKMSYTVTGGERARFDVLVFSPDDFEEYRRTLEGESPGEMSVEESLSRGGVDDNEVSHAAEMPRDSYRFVIDNTNLPGSLLGVEANQRREEPIEVDIELTVEYPGITDRLPF
jgi:hypothetical protein